jgi:hypothetical protein
MAKKIYSSEYSLADTASWAVKITLLVHDDIQSCSGMPT